MNLFGPKKVSSEFVFKLEAEDWKVPDEFRENQKA